MNKIFTLATQPTVSRKTQVLVFFHILLILLIMQSSLSEGDDFRSETENSKKNIRSKTPQINSDSNFEAKWVSSDSNETLDIAWGDADGDGDLDLAIANGSRLDQVAVNQLYVNEDNNEFSITQPFGSEQFNTVAIAWGDVDGDGDLDLAMANEDEVNQLFLNNGVGEFIESTPFGSDKFDSRSLAWGDADLDGDLDLVIGNRSQGNQLFENMGNGIFEEHFNIFEEIGLFELTGSDLAWGDMDNDGDLDLLTLNGYGPTQIILYENFNSNGLLTQPFTGMLMGTAESAANIVLGDVNGDNYLDVFIADPGFEGAPNQLYINDGAGSFQLQPPDFFVEEGGYEQTDTFDASMGDMDRDGDLDLLVGNSQFPTQIFENNGVGKFSEVSNPIGSDSFFLRSIEWGDIDGDGDLDFALASWRGENYIFENKGGTIFLERTNILAPKHEPNIPIRPEHEIAWGDLDSDGDLDYALCSATKELEIYRNDGNGQFIQSFSNFESLIQCTGSDNLFWVDIDNDNDLDLIINEFIYKNDAAGKLTLFKDNLPYGDDHWGLRRNWEDIDGDEDLDFVVGNCTELDNGTFNAALRIFTNLGKGEFEEFQVNLGDFPGCLGYFEWQDIENDGDPDLIIREYLGELESFRVYQNQGDRNLFKEDSFFQIHTQTVGVRAQDQAWGDMDGDGDLDFVIANEGPNRLIENLGNGEFADRSVELGANNKPTWGVEWVDVNNDGDLDIIFSNLFEFPFSDGIGPEINQVYQNLGNGKFAEYEFAKNPFGDEFYQIEARDIDFDGDIDLVGYGVPENSYFVNGLQGSFTSQNNLPSIYVHPPFAQAARNTFVPTKVLSDSTIPITFEVSDPEGDPIKQVRAEYSLNGGSQWFEAVPTQNTQLRNLETGGKVNKYREYDLNQPVPDLNSTSSTLTIEDNFQIANIQVVLSISHTSNSDLSVFLHSPTGTQVELFSNLDGAGSNFTGTYLADAAFTPIISGTAPFTGTFKPEGSLNDFNGELAQGTWELEIIDSGLDDVGTLSYWGLNIVSPPETHLFEWDTFASGFFGKSNNVVLRIIAQPQSDGSSPNGTFKYFGIAPYPIQRTYSSAASPPFRVRGTQIQVVDRLNNEPLNKAIVYRHSQENSTEAKLLLDQTLNTPFASKEDGFLSGRGQLEINDRLIALHEIPSQDALSIAEKISLYHTSAAVTESGLDFFTVENPGVQTLKISEENQLILLNLSLSLEWDAFKDVDYLSQLEQDLERASEILFDLTNGQVALGETIVYNNKAFWDEADIVIYVNNTQRPSANLGGIVEDAMSDINADGEEIPFAFLPGQIRMPPTWNRYGNPSGTIGEDWPRVLAHEIGHYALFLLDNYLGLDDKNNLILIDCKESAMTDAYRQDYSEFLTQAAWDNDPDCQRSVAEKATGRSDWETILLYYGSFLTNDQSAQTGDGPRSLPLDVTQVVFTGTNQIDPLLLESPYFYLNDSAGQSLALGQGQASGYLFKNQETEILEDDLLVSLGSPVGPLLQARGVRDGDKVCVYDYSFATTRTGCLVDVGSLDSTIPLSELSIPWEPDIQITPQDNKRLQVKVVADSSSQLQIQVYPTYRPSPQVKALVKSVTPSNGSVVANFDFPMTIFHGHVRVFEVGSSPRREVIVPFSITPKWDGNSFSAWGGNLISGWDGNSFSTWGGNSFSAWGGNSFSAWGGNSFSAWGAPVASSDGQVVLFDTQNIIGGGNSPAPAAVMQAVQNPLHLPVWFTPVGQAYRYDTDGGVDTGLVVQFRYLERELPLVNENTLNIYHLPDGGTTWNKLETDINSERNQATAPVPGIGTYALIATIELPAFAKEWNNFGYPIQESRSVAEALESIEGKYTSVYQYNPTSPNRWFLYDAGVIKNHSAYINEVNDLQTFKFGKAYWLYATEPIVGYLKVEAPSSLRASEVSQFPPATYYGHMLDDGYEVGMSVEVKIGENVCGATELKKIGGHVSYVVQVRADDNDGCGEQTRTIQFYVDGDLMAEQPMWSNSKAIFKPLSAVDIFVPTKNYNILLPLIAR